MVEVELTSIRTVPRKSLQLPSRFGSDSASKLSDTVRKGAGLQEWLTAAFMLVVHAMSEQPKLV
jgi:hypothetical protein